MEVDPADYPPTLGWEDAVWSLYLRVCTQWRHKSITHYTADGIPITPDALSGLDYTPIIALMQRWQWDIDLGLELLQVIELEIMNPTKVD